MRLHSTRQLLLSFGVAAAVFCAAFGLLAARLVFQERNLGRQRAAERLDHLTSLVAQDVLQRLATVERSLDQVAALAPSARDAEVKRIAAALPVDSLIVTVSRDSSHVLPPGRVLFAPFSGGGKGAREFRLEAADRDEFERRDYASALVRLRRISSASDPEIRAESLIRIARILRKLERRVEALAVYDELMELGGIRVAGLPAEALASYGRCLILAENGDEAGLHREASRLSANLYAGRWELDRAAWQFYEGESRKWLQSEPAATTSAAAAALARSAAVEALVVERDRTIGGGQPGGRRHFRAGTHSFLLVWRKSGDDLLGLVAGPLLFTVHAPRVGITAHLIEPRPAMTTETRLVRSFPEAGIPWMLEVSGGGDVQGSHSPGVPLVLLTGVAAIVLFLMTMYFISRAIAREMETVRLRNEFVGAVSHEFRTPLASIRQMTEMLADGRVAGERLAQYYESLRWEGQRLQRLVENLLDFQRIEAGVRHLRFEPIDLCTMIPEIAAEFECAFHDRNCEIEVRTTCGSIEISADRDMLERALWNLLDNAVKYSPESPRTTLTVDSDEHEVRIAVQDRGVGIADADIDSIFTKFTRGGSARIAGAAGSGLGLAIAREIVEFHRGRIVVESEPGVGSVFTIILPHAGGAS